MTWALIPNPGWKGETPRILEAGCHDRSPFITVACRCGEQMHMHETQTALVPADVEIASTCRNCGRVLVFPPGFFAGAFQQLRDEGWVA